MIGLSLYRDINIAKSTYIRVISERCCSSQSQMECPIVSCRDGKVRGKISSSLVPTSKPVFTYRNLPYGRPPTGNLRFMPPKSALQWKGVLDCTSPTNIPMQSPEATKLMQYITPTKLDLKDMEKYMTEDCLNLSVYTTTTDKTAKLPVMVWFYGGAFQMGFAHAHDGTALASLHDVVIVVPNYRVGVFGFFSLGLDSPCSGNAGLLDQHLALQWVQRNIENFGGNKDNVTIFGESAGATSVNHHVNSPMSRGLFHKAISHSGQATLAKLFKRDLSKARKTYFQILGINDDDPHQILTKLQSLPSSALLKADLKMAMKFMAFDPTLDGKFIVKTPAESLKDKDFSKVPYMIGCNDSEGDGMLAYFAGVTNLAEGLTEEEMKMQSLNFLPRMHLKATKECQQACLDFYVTNDVDKYRYSKGIGNIYTDSMFIVPAITTALSHIQSSSGPVYFYFGTYQLRLNHDKNYGPKVAQKVPWCGCDHSDDICMVWGMPFNPGTLSGGAKFTDEEVELSRKCMAYITNFAKFGNPNVGHHVEVQWPKFTSRREYINLNTGALKVEKDLGHESVQFWTKNVPSIMEKYKNRSMNSKL